MKKKDTLKALIVVIMLVFVSLLATMPVGVNEDLGDSGENVENQSIESPENNDLPVSTNQEELAPEKTLIPDLDQEDGIFEENHPPTNLDQEEDTGSQDFPQSPDGTQEGTPDSSEDQASDNDEDPTKILDGHKTFTNEFVEVPDVQDTESEFTYSYKSSESSNLEVKEILLPENEVQQAMKALGPPEDGEKGNKLGNAPEALYRVLQKFLAKGKMPPPNFPVPYVIYTNSSGVEKFTDALTKMPIQINVDNDKDTGQGNGKDIRVRTTMSVNPLEITVFVELKGGTPPPDLQIYVSFPVFFYNGESGDPDGEPYWLFGYETREGSDIPGDITITFGVNQSLGSNHVFDFDWNSDSGIEPLRFRFGTFQVIDQNTSAPIFPAFASFEVSSPPTAGLTFETIETETMTQKCMYWTAPFSFNLSFNFSEVEELVGLDYDYPMTITVDQVPQSFSICTTEDRAANTYSIDYVASSTVDLVLLSTEIDVEDVPTVEIELRIEDMPAELHVLMGDGYLNVDVTSNVGLLALDASADLGLAAIDSMINARLRIYDIPDFNATWYQDGSGNGFALDAPSCVGSIELAFSFGDLEFPAEHAGDPDSHYLFAWSDATKTAIAIRILGVSHIEFIQNNNDQSNTLSLILCDNNVFYVIAHTEVGSLLTPNKDVDLRIEMDETPTEITVVWTVPFTLSITTNDAIDSIEADVLVGAAGPPPQDLSAHAEIHDIPADMTWDIDPSGSIAFTADDPIGSAHLEATDPNGLPGAETFFNGEPVRLIIISSHIIPSFTATWSSDLTPWTAVSFNTAPGTSLGDLTFGISTSITSYVTMAGFEDIKGVIYNDDTENLGNGLVMEASIWIHVVDITRAELGFGGTDPTFDIGFGTSMAHDLKVLGRFDRTSSFNPAPADDDVDILVVTTALPTSMDLTVIPSESFEYDAMGVSISHIDIDASVGDLSPGAPDPADVDAVSVDVYDVPGSADGQWGFVDDSGSISIQLEDGSVLGRVEFASDNAFGVFNSEFEHIEAYIDSLPENVDVDWDMSDRYGSISFSDGTFSGGLGEAFVLATTMDESATTTYINSLDNDPTICMTAYSEYEATIDARYWPGTTLENNLEATYCRNPELNTNNDDYIVFRSGDNETLFTTRIRELHSVEVSLENEIGFAEIQFTSGVTTDRELYIRTEDVDPADDDLVLVELSELPNSVGDNLFLVNYNRVSNIYSFDSSEVIDFIDFYLGTRETTSQTLTWYKFLIADLPEEMDLSFDLEDISEGFLEFVVSSNFEVGVAIQNLNARYAGWIELTGIRFDYLFFGPGDLPSSYDIGYYITRIDIDIHTLPWPGSNEINGIFGIYTLKNNPDDLVGPAFEAPDVAYIPEWTFMLCDFTQFALFVDWDVGITIRSAPAELDIGLFPTVAIVLDFSIVLDFWWNEAHTINLGTIGGVPFPPPYARIDGTIELNPIPDYIQNSPIHILPFASSGIVTFALDDSAWTFHLAHLNPIEGPHWHIPLTLSINVPGAHNFGDHCDPTP
jgi:hypothetical protein